MNNLFLWIVFLGVVAVLLLNALHKHDVRLSQFVTALTTNGAAKYSGIAFVVIIGLIALVWLMPMMTHLLPDTSGSAVMFISILAVVGLAILGALGKGGTVGKVSLSFVALVAVFFALRFVYLSVVYGPHASEAQSITQKRNFDSISGTRPTPSIERVQPIAGTESQEVVTQNFVIPAQGTVSVPRYNKACVTNSETGSLVKRHIKPREITYTSQKNGDVSMRIWLYDQGDSHNCRARYDTLVSQKKIF